KILSDFSTTVRKFERVEIGQITGFQGNRLGIRIFVSVMFFIRFSFFLLIKDRPQEYVAGKK
ncbi:MAG: hypothetical protein ACFFDT_32095, partial [Candidatus Hodarchaeota archaeon]